MASAKTAGDGALASGQYDAAVAHYDEALKIATDRLARIRATDPKKLAFFIPDRVECLLPEACDVRLGEAIRIHRAPANRRRPIALSGGVE